MKSFQNSSIEKVSCKPHYHRIQKLIVAILVAILTMGCAAFHPTNDNIVLLFGGRNEQGTIKTAFKVHLDDESQHNLKDLDFERSYHTCMGFVKKDGRPVRSLIFKNCQ